MKRRTFSEETKQDYLKRWDESGLNANEFSKQNGIGKASLLRWEANIAAKRVTFQTIKVVPSNSESNGPATPCAFATVQIGCSTISIHPGACQRDLFALIGALKESNRC